MTKYLATRCVYTVCGMFEYDKGADMPAEIKNALTLKKTLRATYSLVTLIAIARNEYR